MNARRSGRVAAALVVGLLLPAAGRAAASDLLVADGDEVFRVRDVNGDGDALDPGENTLWAAPSAGAGELTRLGGDVLATSFATSSLTSVQLLRDRNGDGDALDPGEVTRWFDASASGTDLFDIRSRGGEVFASTGADEVLRLVDLNGDGDALDAGEMSLYASGFSPMSRLEVRGAELLVVDPTLGVFSVNDLNGDGDALDVGERRLHATPQVDTAVEVQVRSGDRYFISNLTNAVVQEVADRNSDGDAFDPAEVRDFADGVSLRADFLGGAIAADGASLFTGAGFDLGGFTFDFFLVRLEDLNGDGDAFDVGEAQRYADLTVKGFLDLVAAPALLGDYNRDSVVSAADYTVFRDTVGVVGGGLAADGDGDNEVAGADHSVWARQLGESSPLALSSSVASTGSSTLAVPEPGTAVGLALLAGLLSVGLPRRRGAGTQSS